jgi:hypothetical protein
MGWKLPASRSTAENPIEVTGYVSAGQTGVLNGLINGKRVYRRALNVITINTVFNSREEIGAMWTVR